MTLSLLSSKSPPNSLRLDCEPDYRRQNSPSAWEPASPPLLAWKVDRRCQALRRFCASPRQPAASFTCAFSRLEGYALNNRGPAPTHTSIVTFTSTTSVG